MILDYRDILINKSRDSVKLALDELKLRREEVSRGIKPKERELPDEVREIFELMEEYKAKVKSFFLKSGGILTHISSVSPGKMEGGKIRKSLNRANNYETDLVDAVFASSEKADGKNPYIARDMHGMISVGKRAYIYGGDNIRVKREDGRKRAILNHPNYVYYINPKNFEPVVNLCLDEKGLPFFDFSKEWISFQDIDISDKEEVLGCEKISDVTELLENYQVFTDNNLKGIGMHIRKMSREEVAKFVIEQLRKGDLSYINYEVGINFLDLSKFKTKDSSKSIEK